MTKLYAICLVLVALTTAACSSTREIASADEPYKPKTGELHQTEF